MAGDFYGGIDHPHYGRPACPSCSSRAVRVGKTLAWDHGTQPPTRTRYYSCDACDRRFKTIEEGRSEKKTCQ
jgi:transcriptional regulator NrdR family protein